MESPFAARGSRLLTALVLVAVVVLTAARLAGWYVRPHGPFLNLLLLGLPLAAVCAGIGRGGRQALVLGAVVLTGWGALWIPGVMSAGGRVNFSTAPQGAFVLAVALVLGIAWRLLRWVTDRAGSGLAEELRLAALLAVPFFLYRPFLTPEFFGGTDAQSYAYGMADALAQARAGVFPVWVGQSAYMFEGVVHPLRTAPYHQYLGMLLDLLTARHLGAVAVQHLAVLVTAVASGLSCYWCLVRLDPARRGFAWAMALLYLASPAMLGFAYGLEMYMTLMAFTWLPCVVLANVLLWHGGGPRVWALGAGALALVWYAHAPVGLWLTFFTVLIQLPRLLAPGAGWEPWRGALVGVVCLGGLLLGQFWSVAEISSAQAGPGESWTGLGPVVALLGGLALAWRGGVNGRWWPWLVATGLAGLAIWGIPAGDPASLGIARGLFPDNLLPLSAGARRLGDVQPGGALLAAGLLGLLMAGRGAPPALRALALAVVVALVMYYPVPVLSRWLHAAVPPVVTAVSSASLWQRVLPVLVVLLAFTGFLTLARLAARGTVASRLVVAGLAVALVWSLREAGKVVRAGDARIASTGRHFDFGRDENIRQFAYFFPGLPASPYLVNGVADPLLESRLLDPVAPGKLLEEPFDWAGIPSRPITATPEPDNPDIYRLTPGFTLAPGERKALRFLFSAGDYAGTLILRGTAGWYREYQLPEAGFGALSFGVAPARPKVLAIWNSGAQPQAIEVQFARAADKPGAVPPRNFAEVAEQSYMPGALRVRTDALIPYRATVVLERAAWLETPRAFIPGYWAKVNGTPVEVLASVNHRAAIKLGPGENVVVMTYPGTVGLWVAWSVSAACWLGLLGWTLAGGRHARPA
jgi:hypothetical protein